jgi:hypothetical protein
MSETSTETPAPEPPTAAEAPPWGTPEEFNPEKAWNLIQALRADKEKLAARPVLDDTAKAKLAEYERLEQASKTDLERKAEEVTRWQAEAEKWRATSVSSQIQALAAADFADATDAVNALNPAKYLDAGGEVNTEAIKTDLAALLEAKPHYRRVTDPQAPRLPAPNPNQGSGANGRSAGDPAQEFAAILGSHLR